MEKKIYSISNGFADSGSFTSTESDAIKECENTSRSMNTANWLHVKKADGKWETLGRTFKAAPLTWEFRKSC